VQIVPILSPMRIELCNPLDIRVLWHAVAELRRMFHGDGVCPGTGFFQHFSISAFQLFLSVNHD
jgi:hypothetical protein